MKRADTFRIPAFAVCSCLVLAFLAAVSFAETKASIDAKAQAAMDRFKTQVEGADIYLKDAKGVLVMPDITKAGLVLGGEHGDGALMIGGKNVAYYSVTAASAGLQAGVQKFDMVLIFLTDEALKKFRESSGWTAGADANVVIVKSGASGEANTLKSQNPILGFVFGEKGLMAGVAINGSKFSKIAPD
jgi:lipid-binding SYLF domain-containing protein